MSNENNLVPYMVHEDCMVRMERTNRRCFIVILILIISLIATNGAWLYYEGQWETQETVITQDNNNGINNYIGNNGDITNGETNNQD